MPLKTMQQLMTSDKIDSSRADDAFKVSMRSIESHFILFPRVSTESFQILLDWVEADKNGRSEPLRGLMQPKIELLTNNVSGLNQCHYFSFMVYHEDQSSAYICIQLEPSPGRKNIY